MANGKTIAPVKGGNTKMFGKKTVGQQAPGMTSNAMKAGPKFAAGGKTKMFGFTGSKTHPGC